MATDLNMEVMLKEINIFTEHAVVVPLQNNSLVADTTISLPCRKLKDISIKTKGAVMRQNLHSSSLYVNSRHDGVHILLYARDWEDASIIREPRSPTLPQSRQQHSPHTLFTPSSSTYDEDFPSLEQNTTPTKTHSKQHKRTVFRQPDVPSPPKVKRRKDVQSRHHVDPKKCVATNRNGRIVVNLQESKMKNKVDKPPAFDRDSHHFEQGNVHSENRPPNDAEEATPHKRKTSSEKCQNNVCKAMQEVKVERDSEQENPPNTEKDDPYQRRKKHLEKSQNIVGEPVLGEKDHDFEEKNPANVEGDILHGISKNASGKSQNIVGQPMPEEKAGHDSQQENPPNAEEDSPHVKLEKTFEESQINVDESVQGQKTEYHFEEANLQHAEEGETAQQKNEESCGRSENCVGEPIPGKKADHNSEQGKSQNIVGQPMPEEKAGHDSQQENPPNAEEDSPHVKLEITFEESQINVDESVQGQKTDHHFEEANLQHVEEGETAQQKYEENRGRSENCVGEPIPGKKADHNSEQGKSQNIVGQPMPEEKAGHDSHQENPPNAEEDSPHVKLEITFEESQINVDESVQGQKTDHHFEEATLQHVEEGETAQQKNEENCGRSENCVGEPIPGKKADHNSEQGKSQNIVGQPMPEEKAGHDSQQENPPNAEEDSPHIKLEITFEESQINVDESVQGQKTEYHFEEATLQHVEEGETAQQKNEENCGRSENCVGETIPGKKADHNSEQGKSQNIVGQPMPEEKAGHDSQQENPPNAEEDSPHVKLEKTFEESQINVDESVQGQKTDHHFEEATLQHVEEGETAQQKNEENCGRSENCVGELIPGKKADRNSEQGNPLNVKKGDTQQRCKSTLVTNIDEIVEMKFLDFLGHRVATAHVFGEQYISCDIFRIYVNIPKRGYTLIDEILSEYYRGEHPAFLLQGRKRAWVLKDALMTVLRQSKSRRNKKRRALLLHELMDMESKQEQSHDLNYKEDSNSVQCAKASESQEHTKRIEEQDLTFDSDVMEYFSLFGKKVPCDLQAESVWLKVSAIFQYVGFTPHIKKRGWKFVDGCLKANGIDSQSVFDNPKKRSRTTFPALEILLQKFRVGDKQRKIQVLTELRAERDRLLATFLKTLHLQKCDISEKNK
ncbi:uncharacterized protein [Diadema antillarum]|uniref:uncharacterized protein n=1 Tax=Diadema antillarum TaxID=105358 RepID=UPI003A8419C6